MTEPSSSTLAATLLTLASVAALACGGPSITSRQIRGPDGQNNWVAITCQGAQINCYARAGEVCPGGYDIADSAGHEGLTSSTVANGTMAVSKTRTTFDGEMLVKCHGPIAAAPPSPPRECMDDDSCPLGVKCRFAADAGETDVGHCDPNSAR